MGSVESALENAATPAKAAVSIESPVTPQSSQSFTASETPSGIVFTMTNSTAVMPAEPPVALTICGGAALLKFFVIFFIVVVI